MPQLVLGLTAGRGSWNAASQVLTGAGHREYLHIFSLAERFDVVYVEGRKGSLSIPRGTAMAFTFCSTCGRRLTVLLFGFTNEAEIPGDYRFPAG